MSCVTGGQGLSVCQVSCCVTEGQRLLMYQVSCCVKGCQYIKCHVMSKEVKDRQCVKALEKFHRTVKQLLRAPGIRRSVNGGVSGDDTAQVTQASYLGTHIF